MISIVRTPDERFANLPGYPFTPRYAQIDGDEGTLRMHYVDVGPPDADPVLLLHGQPTWSYLYRKVIAALIERGHRAVAPDYIGYGRSDKLTDRLAYTLEAHIGWMRAFVQSLDLQRTTMVVQDWGGPIGFGLLAAEPDRFARVVAADTVLHTSDPWLAERLEWANYSIEGGRVVHQEALVDWMLAAQRQRDLRPGMIVQAIVAEQLTADEVAAYDAPFPEEVHRAGLRQMNALIPLTRSDPGSAIDRASFEALRSWHRPFLTIWGENDPGTRGWEAVFQEQVPGAANQAHAILAGAGHFIQEDRGAEFGRLISEFIEVTP
jgi:haloalkane dehalogenase